MFGADSAWIEALAGALMSESRKDALSLVPTFARAAIADVFLRAPPDEALSLVYEAHLSREARQQGGIHYTPPDLAIRVVRDALALSEAEPRSVLDPAMGTGVFLRAAVRVRANGQLGEQSEQRLALADQVFGFDLDARAVLVARRALWLLVGDPNVDRARFDRNLVHADAMLSPTLARSSWSQLLPHGPKAFDLIVMNPPFLGGKRLRTVLGERYAAALVRELHGTNGNTDLSAHFLRRGFEALSQQGVLGAVTTNSIAQGDTRNAGLAQILRSGGHVARAETRVPWPGVAGVVTSLLWVTKDAPAAAPHLTGRAVPNIDAFLSPYGRVAEAARLRVMTGRAFIGCFLRGKGFVFDDEPSGARNPELTHALAKRPSSAPRVMPFIGGEEVMSDVLHRAHRHVIDFGASEQIEAERDAELFELLRARVKPFRDARSSTPTDRNHRASFWRFANHRPHLRRSTEKLSHVLVIPRVASQTVAVRLPNRFVFSDQLVVVATSSPAVLALLNSRVHSAWAALFCSTLGDGLRYTPSDGFETFPIPCDSFEALEQHGGLCAAGEAFEHERARVMVEGEIGLSALMRKLAKGDHPKLEALRDRFVDLDRAAFAAYGFHDLDPRAWHHERGRAVFDPDTKQQVLTRLFDRSMALAQ